MIFVSDPDPIFHLVYDPYQDLFPDLNPVSGPTLIFSNTRYKLFREFLLIERILYFDAFLLKNCQILQFFRVFLLHIQFGSGAAPIRNDFFRTRIRSRIHNTE
jgi:hypothetical protein